MNEIRDRGCVFQEYLLDVAGTVEEERKGGTPKEEIICRSSLGHKVNSFMTVIFNKMGSYRYD